MTTEKLGHCPHCDRRNVPVKEYGCTEGKFFACVDTTDQNGTCATARKAAHARLGIS